jgi:hypothetical protein
LLQAAALVACISPCIREYIRTFGRFAPDMADLPNPLNPQSLPFEVVPSPLFTRIFNLPLFEMLILLDGFAEVRKGKARLVSTLIAR